MKKEGNGFWFERCFFGGLGLAVAAIAGLHLWDMSNWLIYRLPDKAIELVSKLNASTDPTTQMLVLFAAAVLLLAVFGCCLLAIRARQLFRCPEAHAAPNDRG